MLRLRKHRFLNLWINFKSILFENLYSMSETLNKCNNRFVLCIDAVKGMFVNMYGNWISLTKEYGDICPDFFKIVKINKEISCAQISVSAVGVYEARCNGEKIGNFVFAPGATSYLNRIQYQTYELDGLKKGDNLIEILLGTGWCRGRINRCKEKKDLIGSVIAEIKIMYCDGTEEIIVTDDNWKSQKSNIMFSDIYDGEFFDATFSDDSADEVCVIPQQTKNLIPQEGEIVKEHEILEPVKIITTPKNEKVLDFGQNITGYISFEFEGKSGDEIQLSCAEILDSEGNFYNDNYRTAKSLMKYICKDGKQSYKPIFSFFGFRYIRLDKSPDYISPYSFKAVVVHSEIERTGWIKTGNSKVNKLFSNIIWGQKSNFLDIPTDCPQRDERFGWTGDAQVFIKTATYNFDVEKFFVKWLGDMLCDQYENGLLPSIIPAYWSYSNGGAAWNDAITICPWQIYMSYGNEEILKSMFPAMKKYIGSICARSTHKYLWIGNENHFGDWLAVDGSETNHGRTDVNLIASAFYAHSVELVIKTGKILGEDVTEFEELHKNIVKTFKYVFQEYNTQTACALALHFGLAENPEEVAEKLNNMVIDNGYKISTGFVGTPYIMHALSDNGYVDTAYRLLLQEEFPSWLFSVNMGATTIWEHWDGMREDGTLWSAKMNSFNHYAYGSVADWMYSVVGGIKPAEPGFKKVTVEPLTSKELGSMNVQYNSKSGTIISNWEYNGDKIYYHIEIPVDGKIVIEKNVFNVNKGKYDFVYDNKTKIISVG